LVQWAEISWADADRLFKEVDVAILPVGSTEQHGPHNPLGTDHLVAAAVGREVGERTGVPVLPVVPVGVSQHHRQFTGSLWVPPPVFRSYIESIILSAAGHGIRKFVILNGHGGNTSSLVEVAGDLRMNHGVFAAVVIAFPPQAMQPEPSHAGTVETSINLYFHGHLVDMDRAVDTRQKEKLGPLDIRGMNKVGPALFAWDTIDLTETGVLGEAGRLVRSSDASAEKGREMIEPYIEEISRFVEALKKANVEDLLSKPHK